MLIFESFAVGLQPLPGLQAGVIPDNIQRSCFLRSDFSAAFVSNPSKRLPIKMPGLLGRLRQARPRLFCTPASCKNPIGAYREKSPGFSPADRHTDQHNILPVYSYFIKTRGTLPVQVLKFCAHGLTNEILDMIRNKWNYRGLRHGT